MFSRDLPGKCEAGPTAVCLAAAAATMPPRRPKRSPQGVQESCRQMSQAPTPRKLLKRSDCNNADMGLRADYTRPLVQLLRQAVGFFAGAESEEKDDAEAVIVFIIRTSMAQIRVGGHPGESVADLLTRVVRIAMKPEHGGLAGSSVRVCTSGGRALPSSMSLREVPSKELVLAGSLPDGRETFEGDAGCIHHERESATTTPRGRDHSAALKLESHLTAGLDESDLPRALQPSTSFVEDPDLGPAVLISADSKRPRLGSETLLCTLQF